MLLQSDRRFAIRPHIQSGGCYFMAIAFWAVQHAGWEAGITELTKAYDDLVGLGHMSEKCFVSHPAEIAKYFGWQVARVDKRFPDYDPGPRQVVIELWSRPRPETDGSWNHFTAGDYDPMGQSRTRLEGDIDSLRVFTAK